jgi:hypothetical protein
MKHFIDISNFELNKLDSIIQKAKQQKKNPKIFSSYLFLFHNCHNKA